MIVHAECQACHEKEVKFHTTGRGGIVKCGHCGAPHEVWIGEASGHLDVTVELVEDDGNDS